MQIIIKYTLNFIDSKSNLNLDNDNEVSFESYWDEKHVTFHNISIF